MMLAVILLAVWSWDRVLTNCHGNPQATSHYYFQATIRLTSPTGGTCQDDQGQDYACPVMLPGTPIPFGPTIPDPQTGTSVSTDLDPTLSPDMLPTPPVGGLSVWPWFTPDNPNPVVAVSFEGARSDQSCQ